MRIIPDPPKRAANLEKHGLDMADLTMKFFENAFVSPTKEGRYKAIGYFEGQAILVIFKPLGSEAIAPISMRPANKKERLAL